MTRLLAHDIVYQIVTYKGCEKINTTFNTLSQAMSFCVQMFDHERDLVNNVREIVKVDILNFGDRRGNGRQQCRYTAVARPNPWVVEDYTERLWESV